MRLPPAEPDRRFCVAPMMGRTDQHYRWLVRQFCPDILLFTEMLTCKAVLHAAHRHDQLLAHHAGEDPVAVQLAGADPEDFAAAAPVVEARGFAEININVGCPSKRAGAGCFGAALMRHPQLVAELVQATRERCGLPVSVKMRLGVDDMDSEEHLADFVRQVSTAGCKTFYLHARKALLNGISPAMNRRIPPLDYDLAARIRGLFPQLEFVVNGGIANWQQARQLLDRFDGVMVGRAAYIDLPLLVRANRWLVGESAVGHVAGGADLAERLQQRLMLTATDARSAKALTGHLLPLFRALPDARRIRRQIAECGRDIGAAVELLPTLPWEQVKVM